jgi:hypothetical protein
LRVPKSKDEFEQQMLWAFSAGMSAGYAIEHTNITEEEANAIKAFAEENGFKRITLKN